MSEQRFLDQNGVLFLWQKVKALVEEVASATDGMTAEQIEALLTASEEAKVAASEAKAASKLMTTLLGNSNLTEEEYQYYTSVLTVYELPSVGKENILYVVTSTGESYVWDAENMKYNPIPASGGIHDIDIISGGNA